MTFWKVVDETPVDHADDVLKAYRWIRFNRPIQYSPDENGSRGQRMQARDEKTDKISFMVENRAQFVSGTHVYLEPRMVERIFKPFWDGRVLEEQEQGLSTIEYQIHCDPAVVNDMFSVMVAHKEQAPEEDEFGILYNHLIVDYYTVYRPSDFDDGIISYSEVLDDIKNLMALFRPRAVTMDQFNSVLLIQELQSYAKSIRLNCNVFEENATNTKNTSMFEAMKFSINNGLIHSYRDDLNRSESQLCLLEGMLEEVQYVNGRVVKPRSDAYGHCDLVDCLAVLTSRLIGNQRGIDKDTMKSSAFVTGNEYSRERLSMADLSRRFGHTRMPLTSL